MKKLLTAFVAALAFTFTAHAATLAPVQLLSPAGSTSGQVISSTGPSSPPAWTTLSGLMPLAGGTFTGNVGMQYSTSTVQRSIFWYYVNSPRWQFVNDGTSESGGNAGSNFKICRYADAGAFVDCPVIITRSNGVVTFTSRPVFGANPAFDAGSVIPVVNGGTGLTTSPTMQVVTGSRAFGTVYTNTTGRAIYVLVAGSASTPVLATLAVFVGGAAVGYSSTAAATVGAIASVGFMVPVGATYQVNINAGAPTLSIWSEVR